MASEILLKKIDREIRKLQHKRADHKKEYGDGGSHFGRQINTWKAVKAHIERLEAVAEAAREWKEAKDEEKRLEPLILPPADEYMAAMRAKIDAEEQLYEALRTALAAWEKRGG